MRLHARYPSGPSIRYSVVVVLAGLMGCSGNSQTYPVNGIVKQPNGAPLSGGRVFFQPLEGGQSAWGIIAADGTFSLQPADLVDGAKPGHYKVVINPAVPEDALDSAAAVARHRSLIPLRYQNLESTPLQYTVKGDGSENHFEIVIK
jgi:hypothetical protein